MMRTNAKTLVAGMVGKKTSAVVDFHVSVLDR